MKFALLNLVLCMLIACAISPLIIKWLYKLKFGQSILIYVEKHKQKSGTATMGGIIFVLAGLVGYFVFYSKNNLYFCVLSRKWHKKSASLLYCDADGIKFNLLLRMLLLFVTSHTSRSRSCSCRLQPRKWCGRRGLLRG